MKSSAAITSILTGAFFISNINIATASGKALLRGSINDGPTTTEEHHHLHQQQQRRTNQDIILLSEENNTSNSKDGGEGISSRIVGGYQAQHTPWFALTLQKKSTGYVRGPCGAALINRRWAVTAAHCVSNYFKDDLRSTLNALYVGAFQPWTNNADGEKNFGMPQEVIKISRVIEHPDHNPGSATPHDIALIELEEDVSADFQTFYPVELASPGFEETLEDGNKGTVYGFGQTSFGGPLAKELLAVDVAYVPQKSCVDMMDRWEITDDMTCYGGDGTKDSCGGDSGGPLVVNGKLVGVVSWGYKCAERDHPGIYSSVTYHHDWIKGYVGDIESTTTQPMEDDDPITTALDEVDEDAPEEDKDETDENFDDEMETRGGESNDWLNS